MGMTGGSYTLLAMLSTLASSASASTDSWVEVGTTDSWVTDGTILPDDPFQRLVAHRHEILVWTSEGVLRGRPGLVPKPRLTTTGTTVSFTPIEGDPAALTALQNSLGKLHFCRQPKCRGGKGNVSQGVFPALHVGGFRLLAAGTQVDMGNARQEGVRRGICRETTSEGGAGLGMSVLNISSLPGSPRSVAPNGESQPEDMPAPESFSLGSSLVQEQSELERVPGGFVPLSDPVPVVNISTPDNARRAEQAPQLFMLADGDPFLVDVDAAPQPGAAASPLPSCC